MATIKDFNDQEELGGGTQLASSSGSITPGSGSTSQTAGNAPSSPSQGSGWVNLQRYLDVNKGQAGGLADQIGQNANKQVDEFKQTTADSAVSELNKASQSDVAQNLSKNVAANAGQAKEFLGSSFGGKAVNDYTANWRNQGQNVKNELGMLNDQGYQKATLQRLNNKPTQAYSSGFGALDSFLVSSDPNARAKLTMTQGRAGEVDQQVNNLTGQVQGAYDASKAAFDANQQAVRNAAISQYGNIMSGAQGRVEGARQQGLSNIQQQAQADLVNRKTGDQNIANVTFDRLDPFYKQNANFGATDVLTDQELADLNALASIESLGFKPTQRTNNQAYSVDQAGLDAYLAGVSADVAARRAKPKATAAKPRSIKSTPASTRDFGAPIDFLPTLTAQTNTQTYQPGQVAIDTSGRPVDIMVGSNTSQITPIEDPFNSLILKYGV